MTMPTPPVLNRIHPVIWATLAMLAAAAVLMAPACSALQEASKETSAIGSAAKQAESESDAAKTEAEQARAAIEAARKEGVSPGAEPFLGGSGWLAGVDLFPPGGDWRLDDGSAREGDAHPLGADGLDRKALALDWRPEVGWHRGGVPLPAGFGDVPGCWGGNTPGPVGCWSLGELGHEGHGEAGRRGDGHWAPRPGGGSGPAPSVGSSGEGLRPSLRLSLQGGEVEGGSVARAWSYPGPRIALAGLSDAGYLDLIVCFWLAMFGQWLAGKAGVGSGTILKRLLGWLATYTGAVVTPSPNRQDPTPQALKPPGE